MALLNNEKCDWRSAIERLQQLRESNTRASEDVITLGEDLITNHCNKLGSELWNIYEQVCMAAFDCGRFDLSEQCIDALEQKFPNSNRVSKLHAMNLEGLGSYQEAEEIYKKILANDKSNTSARKRLIAIYKAIGEVEEAISQLNSYLECYMTDQEAWMELSDLYMSVMDYTKAVFCLEELILASPYNHLYYQRCGEIYYTMGGIENFELARKNFAQSLKLNKDNMRSLYGFLLASSHLLQSTKISSKSKKDNSRYCSWASAQITEKYKNAKSRSLKVENLSVFLDSMTL